MKNIFLTLISLLFVLLHPGFSQNDPANPMSCAVHIEYPKLSISKEQLYDAQTLVDLNRFYKPSWVREYISVETSTIIRGENTKVVSKNDTLSQKQKNSMKMADVGTDITVQVKYIPENTLAESDPKETHFTFQIDPDTEAQYAGGPKGLEQYLKTNITDKIAGACFQQYQLAAVKFTIDEQGRVTNPHVFWPSEDENTDALLLEAVCNMPDWKPAGYSNGIKVKQELVLTLGDMSSCVVPLLNIRQE